MLFDGHQNFDNHPDRLLTVDVHVFVVMMRNATGLLNFGDFWSFEICMICTRYEICRICCGNSTATAKCVMCDGNEMTPAIC